MYEPSNVSGTAGSPCCFSCSMALRIPRTSLEGERRTPPLRSTRPGGTGWRRLIRLDPAQSIAQRLQTALGQAEQLRNQPNDQGEKTDNQDEHQDGVMENEPNA